MGSMVKVWPTAITPVLGCNGDGNGGNGNGNGNGANGSELSLRLINCIQVSIPLQYNF